MSPVTSSRSGRGSRARSVRERRVEPLAVELVRIDRIEAEMNVGDLGDQHPLTRLIPTIARVALPLAAAAPESPSSSSAVPAPAAGAASPARPRPYGNRGTSRSSMRPAGWSSRRHGSRGSWRGWAAAGRPTSDEASARWQLRQARRALDCALARPLDDLVGAMVEPAVQHVAGREGDRPDAVGERAGRRAPGPGGSRSRRRPARRPGRTAWSARGRSPARRARALDRRRGSG